MEQLLTAQYEEIKGARGALFAYCRSMKESDLFKKVEAFNNNSIIDLLVHNANTYISWLKNLGLDGTVPFHESEDIQSFNDVERIFEDVNLFVGGFLQKYSSDYQLPFTKKIAHKGIVVTVKPLQLFTHVVTHEFHHKGQILTMSRMLGYTPVYTDVIRT